MSKKATILAAPPNLNTIPRVEFMPGSFQQLVWEHGYDVTIEPGFPCPCKDREVAQSICLNCMGVGWVWGSKTQMKAVIQSINKSTQYKQWSAEMLGTANMTIEQRFQLAYMDKVTISDSVSIFAENLLVRELRDGTLFVMTCYPVKEIEFVKLFKSAVLPLEDLTDYDIQGNKIIFASGVEKNSSITVRYKHHVQYVVIDLNHDIRNVYVLNDMSREQQEPFPVSCVIRKLHYVPDAYNFSENNILMNQTN